MSTKATFISTMGTQIPIRLTTFTRTSGNICTATAHGWQTGAGPFKVITSNADAPSGLTAAVRASLVYTANTDLANETITVNGKTYTYKAAPSADGEVDVGASDAESMENMAAAINMTPLALDSGAYGVAMQANSAVHAFAAGDTLTVIANTLDKTTGEAIAVAEAAAGSWAGGGLLLTGGVDGTDYYIIRLTADTFSFATSKANAIAGTAVALADAGTGCHQVATTWETLAEALEDSLTERLTHVGTRTMPADRQIYDFWTACIDGVAGQL